MNRTSSAILPRIDACSAALPERSKQSTIVKPRQRPPTSLASAAMQRYARGDSRAFESVYRLLAPSLYRVCRRLCGPESADDLMQEVFLKIHRARAIFAPDGDVMSWASAIARTTFLDQLRYRRRRPEIITEPYQIESRIVAAPCAADGDRHRRELDRRLGGLSKKLGRAYWLVKCEGMSCAEAARELGASENAVKQRVHRARGLLKQAQV